MTIRQALTLLLAILVVLTLGYGTYALFFSGDTGTTPTPEGEVATDAFPIIPEKPVSPGQEGTDLEDPTLGGETGELIDATPEGTRSINEILTQITTKPVSGAFLVGGTGSTTALRYIEKETGNLFELKEGETAPTRLSNTTIVKIQEALANNTGTSLVLRAFQGPENAVSNRLVNLTYSTSTTGTATIGELLGTSLPSTITNIVVSPDGKSLFFLNRAGEGVVGITADFQNKKQTQIFSSLLTEWSVSWPTQSTIVLTTKASQKALGDAYLLDVAKKTTDRVISHRAGLTALLAPDKNRLVYSEATQNGFLTKLLDRKSGSDELFILTTLPEKCVWSSISSIYLYCAVPTSISGGSYPDDWYRGAVSFNDDIWQINTETGESYVLLENAGDATNLMLDRSEENLYFTKKTDETLWKLKTEIPKEE